MFECLIIGDSIAQGTAEAVARALATRCTVVAKVGASTRWAAEAAPRSAFDTIAIATGSNDAQVPGLTERLADLRLQLHARRAVWITPYDPVAARAVRVVARSFGDQWIDLAEMPSRDGLHPQTYTGLGIALIRGGYAGR